MPASAKLAALLAGLLAAAPAMAGEVNVWIVAGQSNAPGLVDDGSGGNPLLNQLNSRVPGAHVTVSHGQGGTSLDPSYTVRPTWHPSVRNKKYDALRNELAAALAAITAAGNTPVIRGMFWMQGEQDAKAGNVGGGLAPPAQPAAANNYGQHLRDLIAAIRADTGVADLPFIIGLTSLGDDPAIALPGAYDTPYGQFDYLPVIQQNQMAVAAADPFAALALTDPSMLGPDYKHLTPAGHALLAERMVDAYIAIPEPASLGLLLLAATALRPRRRR